MDYIFAAGRLIATTRPSMGEWHTLTLAKTGGRGGDDRVPVEGAMRRSVPLVLLVAGVLLCAVSASPIAIGGASPVPAPPDWFWGCWTVKKLLPTSGVSGISQEQADKIIGTHIAFGRTCVRSGDVTLAGPEYSVRTLTDGEFFELGYATLKQLGIDGNSVTEVQLAKPERQFTPFPGEYVYLREKDIVIDVENAYFLAERARADEVGCTCEKKAPR